MSAPSNRDLFRAIQSLTGALETFRREVRDELRRVNGNLDALRSAYQQHGLQIGELMRATPPPVVASCSRHSSCNGNCDACDCQDDEDTAPQAVYDMVLASSDER